MIHWNDIAGYCGVVENSLLQFEAKKNTKNLRCFNS